jgi:predicted solute-binding protein
MIPNTSSSDSSHLPVHAGVSTGGKSRGMNYLPVISKEEEIHDLKRLIKKLQGELTTALETIVELRSGSPSNVKI